MSSNRRSLRYWVNAWLPVLLGILAIVLESTEWMGSNHTSTPFRWLFQHFFGPVSDAAWEPIHHVIRKTGHFLGYGFIGLAWFRAWHMSLTRLGLLLSAALGLAGVALIASCDEWHQNYLPNRTGSPWDVLLDCSGAVTLLTLTLLLALLRRRFFALRAA